MTQYLIFFGDSAMSDPVRRAWVPPAERVTDGLYLESKDYLGGFGSSTCPHARGAEWAAKIAVACRCAQEVRELLYGPDV